jgi:hypothetical protein
MVAATTTINDALVLDSYLSGNVGVGKLLGRPRIAIPPILLIVR